MLVTKHEYVTSHIFHLAIYFSCWTSL